MRVLILGGTAEARELAARLGEREGLDVVSSLAGRLANPLLPQGEVRVGGFGKSGGVHGLSEYLRSQQVDLLIDATHPFASTITANAVQAAGLVGCRLIRLDRPGWTEGPGDDWTRVADLATAAEKAAASAPGVIFLTTGRQELAEFASDTGHEYLVRSVERPTGALPPRNIVILARGPFSLDSELAVMREHRVRLLVSKDTGGPMTEPKLAAARELGIAVVLVNRPPMPAMDGRHASVSSVEEVVKALDAYDLTLQRSGDGRVEHAPDQRPQHQSGR